MLFHVTFKWRHQSLTVMKAFCAVGGGSQRSCGVCAGWLRLGFRLLWKKRWAAQEQTDLKRPFHLIWVLLSLLSALNVRSWSSNVDKIAWKRKNPDTPPPPPPPELDLSFFFFLNSTHYICINHRGKWQIFGQNCLFSVSVQHFNHKYWISHCKKKKGWQSKHSVTVKRGNMQPCDKETRKNTENGIM